MILSSNGKFLFDKGYKPLGIPFDKISIGYITTASKGVEDKTYLNVHKNEMRKLGLKFEEMDIEGKSKTELENFLSTKNVVHVEGGNTFYLLKAMRETGFDKIIKECVENGLIYLGTSAGAYIACPTIETSTWLNEPLKQRYGLTDLRAMHLVPFIMRVHYTDEQESIICEKMKESHYPLRIVRDGQAILVENDRYTFVGEGKEVIL